MPATIAQDRFALEGRPFANGDDPLFIDLEPPRGKTEAQLMFDGAGAYAVCRDADGDIEALSTCEISEGKPAQSRNQALAFANGVADALGHDWGWYDLTRCWGFV
jgi:hypothetical protein